MPPKPYWRLFKFRQNITKTDVQHREAKRKTLKAEGGRGGEGEKTKKKTWIARCHSGPGFVADRPIPRAETSLLSVICWVLSTLLSVICPWRALPYCHNAHRLGNFFCCLLLPSLFPSARDPPHSHTSSVEVRVPLALVGAMTTTQEKKDFFFSASHAAENRQAANSTCPRYLVDALGLHV